MGRVLNVGVNQELISKNVVQVKTIDLCNDSYSRELNGSQLMPSVHAKQSVSEAGQ
jgi:hypothetical protein